MGFWSGLARIFRSAFYHLGWKTNSAADRMASNPGVIAGTYDHVLDEKRKRVQTFKTALSTLVAQQEDKTGKLKNLSDEVARYEKLKAGALAEGKKVAAKYSSADEAAKDVDYQKHLSAYRDFSTTLDEKKKRVAELESDINGLGTTIAQYTGQLQSLMRELEQIAQEKNQTIADVVGAKQQQEVADLMSGLAQDTTSKDLQTMRDMRSRAKASAKVSQTVAGLDTKTAESEYLASVDNNEHTDEFAALMNFKTADKSVAAAPIPVQVPET